MSNLANADFLSKQYFLRLRDTFSHESRRDNLFNTNFKTAISADTAPKGHRRSGRLRAFIADLRAGRGSVGDWVDSIGLAKQRQQQAIEEANGNEGARVIASAMFDRDFGGRCTITRKE